MEHGVILHVDMIRGLNYCNVVLYCAVCALMPFLMGNQNERTRNKLVRDMMNMKPEHEQTKRKKLCAT